MTKRVGGAGDTPAGDAGTIGFGHGHVTDEIVAAYADGEVEASVALEVERHVMGCATCHASLRMQRAVRDRLEREAGPDDVSAALRTRIFSAVRAEPAHVGADQARPGRGRWGPGAVIAALAMRPAWTMSALLAAALVMALWVGSRPGRAPLPAGFAGTFAGESSDTAAIVGLIQGHASAWNQRDAEAVVALLTDDAVWVTSTGEELRGPEAIRDAHVQWLAQDSLAGGTTHVHPPGSINIRFLREDVAVADLEGAFRGDGAVEGQDVPVELARIFVVATKDGDEWRLSQLRNIRRQVGTTGR
jgi:uncharacterized protein (TIGR02246 family)